LIIIDTAHQSIPWRTWIQVIKTSSATRRIPIIAFGSHVLEEPLTDATEAGADQTISRGRLQASLAELITKWSMIPDHDAIALACGESLSEDANRGVELIAKGHYYDAHEILEMVWQNARGAENYLLRTLLQVSVTYLHIERGNLRGAMKMLLRVKHWLAPLPSECQGINVEALGGTLAELRAALEKSDLEGTQASFTQFLVPIPLEYAIIRRWLWILEMALGLIYMLFWMLSSWASTIAETINSIQSESSVSWWITLLAVTGSLAIPWRILTLPLSYYSPDP
jgi:predicted metal-dependent hydrolase